MMTPALSERFSYRDTAELRQAFVETASAVVQGNAREGRDKSGLSVEFFGGQRGVKEALQVAGALQEAQLIHGAAEKTEPFEALPGSVKQLGNAEVRVLAGGLVSLKFDPAADLSAETLKERMGKAAQKAVAEKVTSATR